VKIAAQFKNSLCSCWK